MIRGYEELYNNVSLTEKIHVLFDTSFEKTEDIFAALQLLLEWSMQVDGILIRSYSEGKREIYQKAFVLLGNKRYPEKNICEYNLEELEKATSYIIEKTEGYESSSKQYLCVYGSLDSVYAVLERREDLAKRLIVIWMGDFENCFELEDSDGKKAEMIFTSDIEIWHISPKLYKQIRYGNAQLEARMKPMGEMGAYLYERVKKEQEGLGSVNSGGMAAMSLLMSLGIGNYKLITYGGNSNKKENPRNRCKIREYQVIDNRLVLEDFLAKLTILADEK